MITVKDLSWQYEQTDFLALKEINLQVEKGELVLIMGASGAGKSTLCKTLNGLIPNTYRGTGLGKVFINGLNNAEKRTCELAGTIGMVFQDPDTQLVTMAVIDEVLLGMEHLRVPKEEMSRRLEWVAKKLRIEDLLDRQPYDLSGGQKQRVAVASILAMKPDILILDEPTSELDPRGKDELFESIESLHKSGITILMVAHASEEAVRIADRIILIENGEITRSGSPREFYSDVSLLQEKGVFIPQVINLANKLGLVDVPLTIPEALLMVSKEKLIVKPIENHLELSANNIIEVNNLKHSYDDGFEAVSGITFSVKAGEMIAIIGQNGSGKTTLVKHFNKLLSATSGEVLIDGGSISNCKCTDVSKTVGYVFQNPDFQICTNSVHEEARFGLINIGVPEDEMEKLANHALEMVGLSGKTDEHPFSLSKGERQRLAVASVLAMEPAVIIFDEPTTGQDARQGKEIMELIKKLNEVDGKTIVIITHDMEIVAEYCRRVLIINKGRLIADGKPEEVFLNKEMLHEAFLKAPQITRFSQALGIDPVISLDQIEAIP